MKAILLAGGLGTRLYPLTSYISKQLLPVYDKPVIYYPMSTLMLAGIKEVLIISTASDIPHIKKLFRDGSHLGMHIEYAVQEYPKGIAEAFIIGEKFIGNSSVCLILGDNLFFSQDWHLKLSKLSQLKEGAHVMAYHVSNPKAFGVIEFDKDNKAISLEEKPHSPKSSWAVPGLYFYDNQVVEMVKKIKPSARGELEITTLNQMYMDKGQLKVTPLSRGVAWFDLGTFENLLSASTFVQILEQRQNLRLAALEEIAYRLEFINKDQFRDLYAAMPNSPYRVYLEEIDAEPLRLAA
ncbi:MAG: glucose-1-phosphate thymidylyltransferase RfbA [Alphaproteobacteria bacterium]|nr:glucose-1-phosphate thymidylyltransferase RfbA [Alphaproteobacteria bacterium]